MNFDVSKTLVVFALKPESEGRAENLGFKTLYTGVGKLNAAIQLMIFLKKSENSKINWIINLGTAGSQALEKGSMVFGKSIIQHDMDVTPLGFELGQTPFDESPKIYTSFEHNSLMADAHKGAVLTGDCFVTKKLSLSADAIDMEAFALAKTCYHLNIEFSCLKYISDGADSSSTTDWPKEVKKGALKFEAVLKDLKKSF